MDGDEYGMSWTTRWLPIAKVLPDYGRGHPHDATALACFHYLSPLLELVAIIYMETCHTNQITILPPAGLPSNWRPVQCRWPRSQPHYIQGQIGDVDVWLVNLWTVQGSTNRRAPGLVNFVPVLAYHFCLNLPAAFTEPGARLLVEPCTYRIS